MDAADREELHRAVEGELRRTWSTALVAGAPGDALDAVWHEALELGWMGLGGSYDALAVVCEALGAVACPLPVADAAALAVLVPTLADDVANGRVRPTLVDERGRFAEAVPPADHGVVLDAGAAGVAAITAASATEGLPRPGWATADLGELQRVSDPALVADAARQARLGLVARAMGAARRGHALAVQHAVDRRQFGRPIGSFQAVSHRLADAATDLAGWDALVARISDDVPLTSEAAIEHGCAAAVRIVRSAQRTLAAIGYFEEHELPWLFRRAHTDVARARSLGTGRDGLSAALMAGQALPAPDLGTEAAALVAELARDLDELSAPDVMSLDDDPALVAALGARGWIAPGLPRSVGGRDAGLRAQMAVDAMVQHRRVPVRVARGVAATLSGVIELFGTDEQRATLLPLIATGKFRCYLGYSEPDVGSDLASLRTRAHRDGDEWVVDGEKLWGTGAHQADYVWLAARTDPDAPRHEGITVFLAPTRLPGWTCSPHRALSGEQCCTTTFDGVRIHDRHRVGPVNGGWPVITAALAAERVVMAGLTGEVGRQLDDLVAALGAHPGAASDAQVAAVVGRLAARRQVAEALLERSAAAPLETGWLQAAMAKLVTSELAEDVAQSAMELLGIDAAVGDFEQALRLAPMYVIGGGTADIQRNLVARGIGLPRS